MGAGGTGAPIAAYMSKAGKDVTLIARSEHLSAIKSKGLVIEKNGTSECIKVKASSPEDYSDKADVIFVCVKFYSLKSIMPYMEKWSDRETVIIPTLNVYGTGDILSQMLPGRNVISGCIYIASEKSAPGVIKMSGDIFRIVFGSDNIKAGCPEFVRIANDLTDSGIKAIASDNIRRDTFRKFSFISPMAITGVCFNKPAGAFKKEGPEREAFRECVKEICSLAVSMGINLPEDMEQKNLAIMDALEDTYTASMHKDVLSGGKTEADGLIFEVIRLADRYGLEMPLYRKLANKLEYLKENQNEN